MEQWNNSSLFHVQLKLLLLRRQVRWSGFPISLRISWFVLICTVKGFSLVSEAEVTVLGDSLSFSMIQDMLAI